MEFALNVIQIAMELVTLTTTLNVSIYKRLIVDNRWLESISAIEVLTVLLAVIDAKILNNASLAQPTIYS